MNAVALDAVPDAREPVRTTRWPDPSTLARLRPCADEDDERGLVENVARLATEGWLRAPLPTSAGGQGLGTSGDAAAIELALGALRALGRVDLPLARLYEGHVNAVKLVELHADAPLRELVRAKVRDEHAVLGVWGAPGRPPLRVRSTAEDGWTLAGAKAFASGLGCVTLAVASVADPHVPAASRLLVVDVDEPSRQHPDEWTASGMRATRSGGYDFEGLRIGTERMLGAPGVYEREPWFEGGTWRYAAAHVGAMEGLVDATVAALAARGRADDPHQGARIGRLAALAVGARATVERAAHAVETADPDDVGATRRAVTLALLARELVEELAVDSLMLVERALGMAAFERGHPIERRRRDLGLYLRQAAPDAKLARAAAAVVDGAKAGVGALW